MTAARVGFAIVAAGTLFLALAFALVPSLAPDVRVPAGPTWPGDALWSARALDLVVQAFLLLTGVFAVLVVLREEPREGDDG